MADHTFTGVFIPAKIWLDEKLHPMEKMILAEIRALSEKTGWCYANNKHFSKWLHCDPTWVSKKIAALCESGKIEVEYSDKKTFSGRKLRVNAEWYYEQPALPTATPPLPIVQTPLPIVQTPLPIVQTPLPIVQTEIKFKNRFKKNENENARARKEKRRDARESYEVETIAFGEEKEREGCLPPAPAPPPAPCQAEASAKTVEEAEARIAAWAKGEGFETVKQRHELARRYYSPADAQRIAAHFCSIYGEPGQPKRGALLSDPVEFFRVKLSSYLANQNGFERAQAHKQAFTSARPVQTQSVLPKALRK
jgi:hypothetical protein